MNKRTYKIGDLSKLFNIGVDSIRYYEEKGLLTPTRDHNNNYRLYDIEDIRNLTMIRELLNLNFSIEEIKEFHQKRNLDNTMKLLSAELDSVNESIIKLYEAKSSILSRLTSFERNLKDNNYDQVILKTFPKRSCILIGEDSVPFDNIDDYVDYYLVKYMHKKNQSIDTIGACDCYTLDVSITDENSNYYLTKNVFFYSDFLNYKGNYTLGSGTYMTIRYRGSLSHTMEYVKELYIYAEKKGLTPEGDPIEFCHIDDYETDNENEYLTEIQLKIKD